MSKRNKQRNPEFPVFGISPLGGNSVEATGPTHAPVTTTEVQAVPLVYDDRVGECISDLAKMELDDRDFAERKARVYQEQSEFYAAAGYVKT